MRTLPAPLREKGKAHARSAWKALERRTEQLATVAGCRVAARSDHRRRRVADSAEVAERYVAAWNGHDPDGVADAFADGGTYEDPTTGGPVAGRAITGAAARLFQAFPDVRFEVEEVLHGPRSASIRWVMQGTNTGAFAGAPPTGAAVALGGAQLLRTSDGLVTSAVGHLDQLALARQLGLQAIIAPRQVGPMRLGTSVRLDKASTAEPGAISFTRIDMGSPDGLLRLREHARPVLAGMAGMGSVIGAAAFNDGRSVAYTVTGWTSPEAASEIMGQDQHRAAMRAFFSGGLGLSAWTSVWVPTRRNTVWMRCLACGTMADAGAGRTCTCGASLPERPPYF